MSSPYQVSQSALNLGSGAITLLFKIKSATADENKSRGANPPTTADSLPLYPREWNQLVRFNLSVSSVRSLLLWAPNLELTFLFNIGFLLPLVFEWLFVGASNFKCDSSAPVFYIVESSLRRNGVGDQFCSGFTLCKLAFTLFSA